jgi:hypothetical protein
MSLRSAEEKMAEASLPCCQEVELRECAQLNVGSLPEQTFHL